MHAHTHARMHTYTHTYTQMCARTHTRTNTHSLPICLTYRVLVAPLPHTSNTTSLYTPSLCQPVISVKALVVTDRPIHQAKHRSGTTPARNSDNKTPSQIILNQQDTTPHYTYYGICLLQHTHTHTHTKITKDFILLLFVW